MRDQTAAMCDEDVYIGGQLQSVGIGLKQAQRARLWSTDGLARTM